MLQDWQLSVIEADRCGHLEELGGLLRLERYEADGGEAAQDDHDATAHVVLFVLNQQARHHERESDEVAADDDVERRDILLRLFFHFGLYWLH